MFETLYEHCSKTILSLIAYCFITGQYLHDFDVWISNMSYESTGSKSLCAHYVGSAGGAESIQLLCTSILNGRYVTVTISGSSETLSVCEIEVFQHYGTKHKPQVFVIGNLCTCII